MQRVAANHATFLHARKADETECRRMLRGAPRNQVNSRDGNRNRFATMKITNAERTERQVNKKSNNSSRYYDYDTPLTFTFNSLSISFVNLHHGIFTVTFVYKLFPLVIDIRIFASRCIDWCRRQHRFPHSVLNLVFLKGFVRGSTTKQLRIHDKPDVDGALPPPVPRRYLVLKKERQMWTGSIAAGSRDCSFSRRFKLSGQFQLSGAKGSPLDKSGSSDAPRVPRPMKKR